MAGSSNANVANMCVFAPHWDKIELHVFCCVVRTCRVANLLVSFTHVGSSPHSAILFGITFSSILDTFLSTFRPIFGTFSPIRKGLKLSNSGEKLLHVYLLKAMWHHILHVLHYIHNTYSGLPLEWRSSTCSNKKKILTLFRRIFRHF